MPLLATFRHLWYNEVNMITNLLMFDLKSNAILCNIFFYLIYLFFGPHYKLESVVGMCTRFKSGLCFEDILDLTSLIKPQDWENLLKSTPPHHLNDWKCSTYFHIDDLVLVVNGTKCFDFLQTSLHVFMHLCQMRDCFAYEINQMNHWLPIGVQGSSSSRPEGARINTERQWDQTRGKKYRNTKRTGMARTFFRCCLRTEWDLVVNLPLFGFRFY